MPDAVFELAILGGASERRYRRLRPDVEAMPWGTIDTRSLAPELVERARRFWTTAAFQEHRTSAACAATAEALVAACAPIDLVALVSRFILDEVAHVEMCARIAAELGGGVPLRHDPGALFARPDRRFSPLEQASELVISVFCVAEAFSVGMQRATAKAQTHPLLKAVIGRIARDEAAHGAFGWTFFDWAGGLLDDGARSRLSAVAARTIVSMTRGYHHQAPAGRDTFGWLDVADYRAAAIVVMEELVREPLRARGLLPVESTT